MANKYLRTLEQICEGLASERFVIVKGGSHYIVRDRITGQRVSTCATTPRDEKHAYEYLRQQLRRALKQS